MTHAIAVPGRELRHRDCGRAWQGEGSIQEESAMSDAYEDPGPTRDEVDGWTGPAVLEFGHRLVRLLSRGAAGDRGRAGGLPRRCGTRRSPTARGKPLGRSFQVKLWPTLIFLKDGKEVARAVRPEHADDVRRGPDGDRPGKRACANGGSRSAIFVAPGAERPPCQQHARQPLHGTRPQIHAVNRVERAAGLTTRVRASSMNASEQHMEVHE